MDQDFKDMAKAIQQDAAVREMLRGSKPTEKEVAEKQKAHEAWIFEHGDHKPDGKVVPLDDTCIIHGTVTGRMSSHPPARKPAPWDFPSAAEVQESLQREEREKVLLAQAAQWPDEFWAKTGQSKAAAAAAIAQQQAFAAQALSDSTITQYYNDRHAPSNDYYNRRVNDPGHTHQNIWGNPPGLAEAQAIAANPAYIAEIGRVHGFTQDFVRDYMCKADSDITAMVDAAMAEMSSIHPPLRRSDCARLIRAALSVT